MTDVAHVHPRSTRRGRASLWTAVLGAPTLWAIHLTLNYFLVQFVCLWQRKWILPGVTLAFLVLTAIGIVVSVRELRSERNEGGTDADDEMSSARFLAGLGLMIATLFFLTIVATGIPTFFFDPCLD